MFHISMETTYRLIKNRCGDDTVIHVTIFSVRDANFIERENDVSYTSLSFSQILNPE
jgi:hypothetical protein